MRSQIRLYAAGTVLAACSLVISGCGPKDDSAAGAPASSVSPSAPAEEGQGSGENAGGDAGGGEGGNGGGSNAGEQSDGGTGNHKPDAPACTEKNTSITIRSVEGSGDAQIQLVNNTNTPCSVHDAPNIILKTSDGEILNHDPRTDKGRAAPLVTVDPQGVSTADLTYESGPVSEGGSQDGISCGKEASSAEISNDKATWQAEIRSSEKGNADSLPGGLIVCGPKTKVSPFQQG